jgi:hypothetical protein
MNSEEQKPSAGAAPSADAVTGSVAEVVNAIMGVGASITRSVAQATAGNATILPPQPGAGPLQEMVHYSVASVTNIVRLVASGAGAVAQVGQDVGAAAAAAAKAARPPAHPTLDRGATLRMPLSIENQGDQPMTGLVFECLDIRGEHLGAGEPLRASQVRFDPLELTVAPHDFEKLTLYVATGPQTALGKYTVVVGSGGKTATSVQFEVCAPAGAPPGV